MSDWPLQFLKIVAEIAERNEVSCRDVLERGLILYEAEREDLKHSHELTLPRIGLVSTELARQIRTQLNSHFGRKAMEQVPVKVRRKRATDAAAARWKDPVT